MQRYLLALVAVVGWSALADDKSGARPTAVSVPSGPGSIEGLGESFEANLNSGSVRQRVSMKVPPGTGGLTPSLGLSYDSGFGNGPVGIGWSLGQSSVQLRTDKGLPRYDGTDTFLLDGAELVQVSAGVYRFKNEGRFLRVRRSGNHWEADTPDGSVLRFGVSPEARIESGGHTFSWALEAIVDRAGNQVVNTYTLDAGQNYLSRIDYNVRAGAAKNRVELDYETRPDPVVDYRAGFPVTTAKRLRAVRTYAQDTLVRSYRLDYQAPNGLSLLVGVTETGSDGVTSLPTVSFEYSKPAGTLQPAAMQSAPASVPGPTPSDDDLVDLNGDGFPDALHAASSGHTVAYNQGGLRFSTPVSVTLSPTVGLSAPTVQVADLDGDGFPDLIAKLGTTSGSFKYFPNSGKGGWGPSVTFTNSPAFAFEDPNVRLLDFDHDGLTDVAQSVSAGLTLWRNKGDGTWEGPLAAPLPQGMSSLSFTDSRLKLADMNGDRLVDLVMVRSGSVTWWPHAGRGTFAAPISIGGAPDVGTTAEANLFLSDLTGDGLTDLVWVDTDHVDYWPLTPAGVFGAKVTIASTPHRDPTVTTVRFADMNGNGSADIVWSTPTAAVNQRVVYLDVVGDVRPNLLTRVQNGMGKDLKLGYTNSGFEAQLAQSAGAPWTRPLPFSVQMLASTKLSDGLGHLLVTAYSYRDPWFAPSTREFRGFAHAERRALGDADSPDGIDAHDFDLGETAEVRKGLELANEARGADGGVFRRDESIFEVRQVAIGLDGTAVSLAVKRHAISNVFDELGGHATITSDSDSDQWGNVTTSSQGIATVNGVAQAGQASAVVTTTYAVNEARWLLHFPAESVTTDAVTGATLARERVFYDGPDFVGLPLGQVEVGFVTRKERSVDANHVVNAERDKHDPFGNVVSSQQPNGVIRTIIFDATHTFPEEEHVPLGDGELVWHSTHDPGTGQTLSATDPNGVTSQALYDALGRCRAIVKMGDTSDAPTERYQFELGAPLSVLTSFTRLRDGAEALTVSSFDGLGRKVRTSEKIGDRWRITGASEYTAKGNLVRQYHAFFGDAPDSPPPTATPVETYTYDALNRLVRRVRSDSKIERSVFRVLARDDYDADDDRPSHQGLSKTTRINHRQQVFEIVERTRDATNAISEHLTHLDTDAVGHSVGLIDSEGHTRKLERDWLGRLVHLVDPDSGERRYVYDDQGNLTSTTNELGELKITFDPLDRLQSIEAHGTSGDVQSRSAYHYDASPTDGLDSKNYLGRLAWVEDDAGRESVAYDARGRISARRRIMDGRTFDVSTTFDGADRITGVTYPTGFTASIATDELGRTTGLTGLLSDVTYNADGTIGSVALANGVTEDRQWDSMGHLVGLTVKSGAKTLRDATMTYDGRGNLESIDDAVAKPLAAKYAYDDLSRLTHAEVGGKVFDLTFASDGNLSSLNGQPASYDAARPHAIAALETDTFVHGPAGILTEWKGNHATIDASGRVRSVKTAKGTTRYTYDYTGRLAKQEGPGGTWQFPTRYFEVGPQGEWLSAFLGETRFVRFQAVGGKGGCGAAGTTAATVPLALVLAVVALRRRRPGLGIITLGIALVSCSPKAVAFQYARFFHQDAVGSTVFTTDESGAASPMTAYSPLGDALGATEEHYRFNGRHADPEAGLGFWEKRQLVFATGRWNAPDSRSLEEPEKQLAQPQGLNPYAYARNNPTTFGDAKGAFEEPIHGALTYHLAVIAGFTPQEAAQIALACSGVDHDPKTQPTDAKSNPAWGNIISGVVHEYHFAKPADALAKTNGVIARGESMDLKALGVSLHTLEDVGFADAKGPHSNGMSTSAAVAALGLVVPGLAAIGAVLFSHGTVGHPFKTMADGAHSVPWKHVADQPSHNGSLNEVELERVYELLASAAYAKHGVVDSDHLRHVNAQSAIHRFVTASSNNDIVDAMTSHPLDDKNIKSYTTQLNDAASARTTNYNSGGIDYSSPGE